MDQLIERDTVIGIARPTFWIALIFICFVWFYFLVHTWLGGIGDRTQTTNIQSMWSSHGCWNRNRVGRMQDKWPSCCAVAPPPSYLFSVLQSLMGCDQGIVWPQKSKTCRVCFQRQFSGRKLHSTPPKEKKKTPRNLIWGFNQGTSYICLLEAAPENVYSQGPER